MKNIFLLLLVVAISACKPDNGAAKNSNGTGEPVKTETDQTASPSVAMKDISFNPDSAYSYVASQVAYGPRVPNTDAHIKTGLWLENELRRHGAAVTVQNAEIKAHDGTLLKAKNIIGQYNPDASDRLLLLAHWDSRPHADKDPDPSKRNLPVDGANDGASGVGVLLEIARLMNVSGVKKGVDILFVDAEDWGDEGIDDSWALGTRYFIENPPVKNYSPVAAILLDMVGGENAIFCREYFSEKSAPHLAAEIWKTAASLGYDDIFQNRLGTAVNDDHVQLIANGIPAIDIIEYDPDRQSFNPRWHTTSDNMEGISRQTLGIVGETLWRYLNSSETNK